jgi:hypothetical protein
LRKYVCAVAIAAVLCASAQASETISYTYDALGRLTTEAHAGTVNSGIQNTIGYDPAGNRSSYAVTGGIVPASLSIADASVIEGGSLVFMVTRAGTTASVVTVNYATANGTAVAGTDYTGASGTLTFAVGDTTKTVTIATIDDTTAEPTETMTVTLSSPSAGVTLSRAAAAGTITDNDSSPITATNPFLSYSTAQVAMIPIATLASLNGNAGNITSFVVSSGGGSATIAADKQSVTYSAPALSLPIACDPAYTNSYSASYSIQNPANGTSVNGTVAIHVKSAAGPKPKPPAVCP